MKSAHNVVRLVADTEIYAGHVPTPTPTASRGYATRIRVAGITLDTPYRYAKNLSKCQHSCSFLETQANKLYYRKAFKPHEIQYIVFPKRIFGLPTKRFVVSNPKATQHVRFNHQADAMTLYSG